MGRINNEDSTMTLRLYLYAFAAIVLAGFVWVVNSWQIDSNKLEAAQTELKQVKSNYAEEKRLRTEQDRISNEKAATYETQLANVRKTNAELAGKQLPIRVCRSATSVPRFPAAASEPATTPSEGLQPAPEPSADIGPDLYRLALEADECSTRLTALQGWITEQFKVK